MSNELQNKVAVVTGGSHGLGKSIAMHLASLGAQVVIIARNKDPLNEAVLEIEAAGGKAFAVSCDASDVEQVKQAAAAIADKVGRVDILINNVGIPAPRTFADTDFTDWDTVLGVNLSSAFYITRALWDSLVSSGAGYVITISGTAGLRGGGSPAYGSTKFGLTGLSYSIAAAGKEHNIRATILYPGGMDTGWRGAPIGKPREESMDPDEVAKYVGYLVTSPPEFVINEAVLNPSNYPFM